MSLATNIVRRGARYYVRVAVPADLQGALGRKEIWKTLGTSSPSEARRLAPGLLESVHRLFEEQRAKIAPSADAVANAVWEFYRRELVLDEHDRLHIAGSRTRAEIGPMFREFELPELRKHLAIGETALVEWAADEIVEREGWTFEKGGLPYRRLCQALLKAKIEAVSRQQERDAGDFSGQPHPNMLPQLIDGAPADDKAHPGTGLRSLYERYAKEQAERVTSDTLEQNRKIIELFVAFVGEGATARAMTRKNVAAWKDLLAEWPIKAAEVGEFKGKKPKQIVEMNKRLGRPTISSRTINKYLTALSAFCRWLKHRGEIAENPVEGNLIPTDKTRTSVQPYTNEQLNLIFRSPVYCGCLSSDRDHLPGSHQITDHRYWLPLMSLFSGARLGELCQLLLTDIREEDGRWVMHITTEDDPDKRLKSKNAYRTVPLHACLVRLGLLERRERLKEAGAKRLFPELKPDARGFLSGRVSRWYGRYAVRVGVKHDKSVNFHSFRHSFIDALRRAGHYQAEFQPLIGHGNRTVTDRYGRLPDGTIERRAQMIDSIRYDGLDLDHLLSRTTKIV